MLHSARSLKALIIISLVCLLLFAGWLFLRPRDDAWQRLQRGGALRVALDPSFPPFENVDADGALIGFDVDLARELGRRLGAPVQFQAIAFDGLVDAVIAGKADVAISAFPLDPRLTQDVRFSQPYFEAGLALVTRADGAGLTTESLAGRRVAVEWGSLGDAWARARGIAVTRFDSVEATLAALAANDADAVILDAVSAALATDPDLLLHAPPLTSDPYVVILPRYSPQLAEAVDAALAAMLSDGFWQGLAAEHFPQQPLPPPAPIAERGNDD